MKKNTCSNCDSPLDSAHVGYCRYCYNHYMKETRRLNKHVYQKERARQKARDAVKKGILIQQPCSLCGSKDSEMHHSDYSKPLDVAWMCRPCHVDFHLLERKVLCAL